MLSACDAEITERSCSCFSAWVLFSFRKATCSLRLSFSFCKPSFLRVAASLASVHSFRLCCTFAYVVLSVSFLACSALNFLLLTHEKRKRDATAVRSDNGIFIKQIFTDGK